MRIKKLAARTLSTCIGAALAMSLVAFPLSAQEQADPPDVQTTREQTRQTEDGVTPNARQGPAVLKDAANRRDYVVLVVHWLWRFDAKTAREDKEEKGITAADAFGDTKVAELTEALWQLDAEAAQQLMESGADVNARGPHGVTPLLFLLTFGNAEAAELALQLGADPNLATKHHMTPLMYAVTWDDNSEPLAWGDRWKELMKTFVNAGADVEKASQRSRLRYCSPIENRVLNRISNQRFSENDASPIIKVGVADIGPLWWLLEHGGDVNSLDCHGSDLLTSSYLSRNFDITYELLQRGANPHVTGGSGSSFAELVSNSPMKPRHEVESQWTEKVESKIFELRGNQELIREARKIDADFAEFRERYLKTPWGAEKERKRKRRMGELDAITDTLEKQIEQAKEGDK